MTVQSKHYAAFWTPSPGHSTKRLLDFDEPQTPEQVIKRVIEEESSHDGRLSRLFKTAPRLDVVVVVPFEEGQHSEMEEYLDSMKHIGGHSLVMNAFNAARRGEEWQSVFSFDELVNENKRWTVTKSDDIW